MSLTTIFTGHTLDLRDIVAIGPPMRKIIGSEGILYIDIHLRNADKINHIEFDGYHEGGQGRWKEAVDRLHDNRELLLKMWKLEVFGISKDLKPTTDDPAPGYKRTRRKKGGEK